MRINETRPLQRRRPFVSFVKPTVVSFNNNVSMALTAKLLLLPCVMVLSLDCLFSPPCVPCISLCLCLYMTCSCVSCFPTHCVLFPVLFCSLCSYVCFLSSLPVLVLFPPLWLSAPVLMCSTCVQLSPRLPCVYKSLCLPLSLSLRPR